MKITLRPVRKEDCRDLWQWRNHPEIRQWCFNSGEIAYENHVEWFDNKLNDDKVKFYISLDENGAKIAQARFDVQLDRAYININLNPLSFGQGLGNKVIRLSSERFFSEVYSIKQIVAEIVDANIISKKAFERAGYSHMYDVERNNQKINVYELRK